MSLRTITGTIVDAQSDPVSGVPVSFVMKDRTYLLDPDLTYMRSGVTAETDDAGAGAPSANLVIASGGAANFIGMDMACILGVQGTMSAGNLSRLEGYLAHTFGLSGNLPGGHTYKSAPPLVTQSGGSGVV